MTTTVHPVGLPAPSRQATAVCNMGRYTTSDYTAHLNELVMIPVLSISWPVSVVAYLPHISIGSKSRILPTDTICFKWSQIQEIGHSYISNFKTATFLSPIVNGFN